VGCAIGPLRQPWVQRASAAWRTVAAILAGFALAVVVREVTRAVPVTLTIALIVALANRGRRGFFALGAVTVGMHRSPTTLEAHVRFPSPDGTVPSS